jgi:hypothetical protein
MTVEGPEPASMLPPKAYHRRPGAGVTRAASTPALFANISIGVWCRSYQDEP